MAEEDEMGAVSATMGEAIGEEVLVSPADMSAVEGEAAAEEVMAAAEGIVIVAVDQD